MFRFGRHEKAGFGATVLLGAVLSQLALAEDIATPVTVEFGTFEFAELNLGMSLQSSSDVVEAGSVATIPGYPLSAEELSLVLDTPEPLSGFNPKPAGAHFAAEQSGQPFRARVVTWIKQRSSYFNIFRLFSADQADPGLHLDVDTDEEELVLEYRVGF
ncbi:MAG: hypothetical protein OER85_01925 [Gammaproteobacteria bacterium]|nr:hypothetical protein [Gammaproteobacteria bacterium]